MSNIEKITENYENSTEKRFAQISEGHTRSRRVLVTKNIFDAKMFSCESYNFQFKQIALRLFISPEIQS